MNKKVSIWLCNFNSKKELENYVEDSYDDNEDSISKFREEYIIDYFDEDFRKISLKKMQIVCII